MFTNIISNIVHGQFMEWMLHIPYKLNDGTSKWQARSVDQKKVVGDRKEKNPKKNLKLL